MSESRRAFFYDAAILGAGLFGLGKDLQARCYGIRDESRAPRTERGSTLVAGGEKKSAQPRMSSLPVLSPDVADLPHEMDGGVKVFHLVGEPVKRKIAPFKTIDAWGYNGSCPGQTIQVQQGDRLRVVFENRLPESTSLHWHGLELPNEQDGVPYISQKPVAPGEKYVYEFTVHQECSFFYHAHSAMQEMMGQIGFFVAHPERDYKPPVDHDYGLILQEWAILPSNTVPNTAAMEFNWLTFNGVSAPMTTPLDRKSTRLNSSHGYISYAVFCLKKKKQTTPILRPPSSTSRLHRRRSTPNPGPSCPGRAPSRSYSS